MADDPPMLRTRASLKSCLKITPPITPERSAAPSPCNSGRTSPSMFSDSGSSVGSGGRKTVSFCSDDELEEVYWADEWDRTPAAATPRLSYQDILELKQLRVHLPYSPPPPPPRQPFTTSTPPPPSSSSSSKPPFPVSRFASAASHTPSKWKNRSEPHHTDVDPEILPYLDAVPIRLLPLLPQSSPEPEPHPPSPEPHPQTPTPTASPETPRKSNFSFLPLLPLQDPPPIPTEPPIQPSAPKRRFNMIFVPVNSAPEIESSPSVADVSVITQHGLGDGMGTSVSAPLPSSPASTSVTGTDPCPDAGQLTSLIPQTELSASTTSSTWEPSSFSMSPPRLSLSLAILPLNPESDTDTETDTYTDTDAESDAPSNSTTCSSLHSPSCDYEGQDAFEDLKTDDELLPPDYFPRIHRESDPGSYFPHGPGQTPPLSVLYPSPPAQTRPLLPLDVLSVSHTESSCEDTETPVLPASVEVDVVAPPSLIPSLPLPPALVAGPNSSLPATPISMSRTLQKKLMLEALPSPTLAPPSPFELEPHSARTSPKASVSVDVEVAMTKLSLAGFNIRDGTMRAVPATKRPLDAAPALRAIAAPSEENTPDGSPLLTVENVRASWDARARASIAAGGGGPRLIAPSLSRRRLSQ
ncbi:hypothetical protein C8Q80DRAFT_1221814 [Daedaleopsis nitida]|nr:hypothetical protein C8Q80DRAFT_1221814 [Daedaleopsis nitida]